MKLVCTALFTFLVAGAWSVGLDSDRVKRSDVKGTATVHLGKPSGTPQHIAAGFLYGIPIKQNQVPDHFYTEMGFNYGRSGGGSQPEPARGWVYGLDEFTVSFALRSPQQILPSISFDDLLESIRRSRLLLQDCSEIWRKDATPYRRYLGCRWPC